MGTIAFIVDVSEGNSVKPVVCSMLIWKKSKGRMNQHKRIRSRNGGEGLSQSELIVKRER